MTYSFPGLPMCKPTTLSTPTPGASRPRAKERQQAELAVAIAKDRAAFAARQRPMSPAEIEAAEAYWLDRTLRSMRAREARLSGKRTRGARNDNPAPVPSGMWAKAISCDAARDTRLTMGARVCLQVIRALSARCKRISRNGLAVTLGVCARTAQRYLSVLRELGYIRTRLIANRAGWVVAQVIEITERVLPKHHRPNVAETLTDGLARAFDSRETRRNRGETSLSPCKPKELNIPGRRAGTGLPAFVGGAS